MTDKAMREAFERRECGLSGEDYLPGSFVKSGELYNDWETQQRLEDYQAGYILGQAHARKDVIQRCIKHLESNYYGEYCWGNFEAEMTEILSQPAKG